MEKWHDVCFNRHKGEPMMTKFSGELLLNINHGQLRSVHKFKPFNCSIMLPTSQFCF